MASKNIAEVVIAGRVLRITGYESTEYLHQVASYINDKIVGFEQLESYRRQSADDKQIMIYMNLADDFFKSKQLADRQTKELEKRDKEMYSLKHDLIESQMAKESLEQDSKEKLEKLKKDSKEAREKYEALEREFEDRVKVREQELQEKLAALEKESKETLETLEMESEERMEAQEKASREEISRLQGENQRLRQQISRLEAEARNRANRNNNNNNRNNGN